MQCAIAESSSGVYLLASQQIPSQTVELSFSGGDLRRRPLHGASAATGATAQPQRSISVSVQHTNLYGLLIAIVGGTIYSLFTPAFNIAVNDPFHLLPSGVPPLSVYCANFYLAIGLFSSSSIFNVPSMQYPVFSSTGVARNQTCGSTSRTMMADCGACWQGFWHGSVILAKIPGRTARGVFHSPAGAGISLGERAVGHPHLQGVLWV